MTITILPHGRNPFPKIVEGLPEFEACPVCSMWFTQMSERDDIEAHINRCVASKAEESRKMIAAGYKRTSKGWVLK
jgi:hypothetical protein